MASGGASEIFVGDALLSNDQLYRAQLALAIACGRSKSALRNKHRTYLCTLFQVLLAESSRRHQAPPASPFKA
jgi:hypothetical protein